MSGIRGAVFLGAPGSRSVENACAPPSIDFCGVASNARLLRLGRATFEVVPRAGAPLHQALTRDDRFLFALQCPANNEAQAAQVDLFGEKLIANGDRWTDLFDELPGDFSFALWDDFTQQLHLGRQALGVQGLYWRRGDEDVRFATLAPELSTKGSFDVDRLVDLRRRTAPILGSSRTGFKDVSAVAPGTLVSIATQDVAISARFGISPTEQALSTAEAADRLRAYFLDSVSRSIEGATTPVATQLSGGRDSGVVTAAAARMLAVTKSPLVALTYAPAVGFDAAHRRYSYDESDNAARVAARYSNIQHHVVRPGQFALCEKLDARHAYMPMPVAAPTNLAWWDALEYAAQQEGAALLLTGVAGNFTVSVGGPWGLNDVLAHKGLLAWAMQLMSCRAAPGSSFASLLDMTFGGKMPRRLYNRFRRVRGGEQASPVDCYLRGDLAAAMRQGRLMEDLRPPRSNRARIVEALQTADFASPESMMLYDVTLRDPTADRRLAEFALSLTPDQLVSRHDRRPLFEAAFGDLLPISTLRPTRKGSQGGDWNFLICPDELREGLDRYAQSASVRERIDIDALRKMIDHWPRVPVVESGIELHFLTAVLPTICLASFLFVHSSH